MTQLAVNVHRIYKQYYIGGPQKKYHTFRESITETVSRPFRRAYNLLRGHASGASDLHEAIWAVQDISFQIKPGEVVGIIGHNGAGKSTLLKILSRITEPTLGYVDLYGRVGSLLEVGTGFHPELTGRDNVFLNGAILGMSRREITSKFDEIVAFAEVEKFIDTPVKFYSTGMQVRLAFAVAAHLEPEILVVDEVLAVGDASFQRKCLNKMQDVGEAGRTVLFVSHNMPAITRLCQRAILLQQGQVVDDGPAHKVVSGYLSGGTGTTASQEWADPSQAPGDEVAWLRAVRIRAESGSVADVIDISRPVALEMEYEVLQPGYKMMPYFRLYNEEGLLIFTTIDSDPEWRQRPRPPGRYVSTAWIPSNYLAEGTFFVGVSLRSLDPMIRRFARRDVVAFQAVDSLAGSSARMDYAGDLGGIVRPLLTWETEYISVNEREAVVKPEPLER